MSEPSALTETEVSERIGIARDVIRAFRLAHLSAPADFAMQKKGGVAFTPRGLARVIAHFEKKEGSPCADDGAGGALAAELAQPSARQTATFYVASLPRNIRVLLATSDPGRRGNAVTVRVRDNRLFAIGMEIQAIHAGGATWNFSGPSPRRRSQRSTIPRHQP